MEKLQKNRVLRLSVFTLLGLFGVFLVYLLYRFTGIGFKCIFFEITNFKCSGCGNTHALESLLELNFLKSLSFNYIYPLEMGYLLWIYLFSAKRYIKEGKFSYVTPCMAIDVIVLIIIVIWFPLRNILGV